MTDNEVVKALEVCAYSDACLKECPFFNYKADCTKRLTASALEIIKRHQSDVAPVRHGRWIECNYGLTFECSECKYPTEYSLTDYCPNCGAKMDGDPYA